MKTMNFQGPGFKLQVPTNWFISSSPQIQAMFVAPPQGNLRANLMVTMRPLEEGVSLADVVKSSLDTQKKEYPEFELLEETAYKLDEWTGIARKYKWYSSEHKTRLLQRQVFFLLDQILTTITTTRTDIDKSEELDQVFTQILQSFHFK
jgi:hypothetical protein